MSATQCVLGAASPNRAQTGRTGQSTIRERLIGGVAWSAAGSLIAQGTSFLTLVLLARVLGRETFGQFALIQSTAVSLTAVSGLGLGVTATKYVSEWRTSNPARVGRVLGLSAAVTLVAASVFSAGLWLAAGFAPVAGGASGELVRYLRISTVYVFFITMTSYHTGAFAGFEGFERIARASAIYGLATLTASWLLAVRWGLSGAVWGQAAGAALLWLLYQRQLSQLCRKVGVTVRYVEGWKERAVLRRFAVPAAACGLAAPAAIWGANLLLVWFGGFAQLAIFSAALTMRSVVLFSPALVFRVTAPILNNLKAAGNPTVYRMLLWRITGINGIIALLGALILSIAGRRVLHLFGREFEGSAWLATVLLGAAVLEVLASNLYQALFAGAELWRNLGIICAWSAVLLVCARVLCARYGADGLAWSYLGAWSVSAALYAAAAWRHFGPGGNGATV